MEAQVGFPHPSLPRQRCLHHAAIQVTNEPILEFKAGSPERAALQKVPTHGITLSLSPFLNPSPSIPNAVFSPLQALAELKGRTEAIPCVVGGEEVWTSAVRYQLSVSFGVKHRVMRGASIRQGIIGAMFSFQPFNHAHKVAKFCYADKVSAPLLALFPLVFLMGAAQ